VGSDVSFGDALWNLRGVDVVLQGLVILMIALGIAIVLYEKRNGGK
jgi:multisubunit Na+/H+ antiporter MnhB subunit